MNEHLETRRSARVRYWERLLHGAERAQGRGDLDQAEGFFRAALTNAEQIEDTFYFGYSLGRLGKLYEDRGWDGAAERCYSRAVSVEALAYDARDVHRVPNIGRLVVLYTRQGRTADAGELRAEIDRVRDAVLTSSPSTSPYERVREAYSLGILANFYQEAKEFDQAEELYWLELTELEATLKPHSPYLVRPLERLSALMRTTGRDDEALELEKRAKEIWEARARKSSMEDPPSHTVTAPKR